MKIHKKQFKVFLAFVVIILVIVCTNTPNVFADSRIKVEKTYIKNLILEDGKIVVNWKLIDNCSGYQLQYSDDPNFIDCDIVEMGDDADHHSISGLLPDKYYFRIRAFSVVNQQNHYSNWSNIKSIDFQFTKTYLMNQVSVDNTIQLTWKVSCTNYVVQYSKNEHFDTYNTITFAQRAGTSDRLSGSIGSENLTPGTYYIRIRTANKINGKYYYSEWSNTKTVEYKLAKTYIKTLSSIDGRIDATWKIVENCSGYQIQYSDNSEMNNAASIEIPDYEFDFCSLGDNWAPGTYYIRIRTMLIANDQTYYSDWSNVKSAKCNLVKTYFTDQHALSDHIVLTWKQIPSCDAYQIQYSKDPYFIYNVESREILSPNICTTKILDLDAGMYYFRIRTLKRKGLSDIYYCSDWSNTKFVSYIPNKRMHITSLRVQTNKVIANWTEFASVTGYELECSTDKTFLCNTTRKKIDSNQITSCAIDATPGHNYFRVRSYTTYIDGTVYSSWSPVHELQFEISPVSFTNIEIVNNEMSAKWDISKGCHGYHIQYSTDANFEQNVETVKIFNTTKLDCIISNLSAGNYYVRISAYKTINQQKCFSEWSESTVITID